MKLNELLNEASKKLKENNIKDAGIIARVLLQFVLKIERKDLIIKQNETINESQIKEYEELILKIIEGVPLQYITKK